MSAFLAELAVAAAVDRRIELPAGFFAWPRAQQAEVGRRALEAIDASTDPEADVFRRSHRRLLDACRAVVSPAPPAPPPAPRCEILIKSFRRFGCLLRLLRTIRYFYPSIPIRVADDSLDAGQEYDAVARRCQAIPGVRWRRLPFNVGLAEGRTAILRASDAERIVMLDDDMVFTAETRLEAFWRILDHDGEVDLIAGLVRMDSRRALNWSGRFQYDYPADGSPGRLRVRPDDSPWRVIGDTPYRRTELAWNFYAARRERLLQATWDGRFKIVMEHIDHFQEMARAGLGVFYTPRVIAGHVPDQPADYLPYRREAKQPQGIWLKKWNLAALPKHRRNVEPGIEDLDVKAEVRRILADRPNVLILTIGHTGSSVLCRMLAALGWDAGDGDEEYGESESIRAVNQELLRGQGSHDPIRNPQSAIRNLPQPWVLKDPRFCETLPLWKEPLAPYAALLLYLDREHAQVRDSYQRRGEDPQTADRRRQTAEEHFRTWTGPKLRLRYEQIAEAVRLFDVGRDEQRASGYFPR